MNCNIPSVATIPGTGLLRLGLPLVALLLAGNAWGECDPPHNMPLGSCNPQPRNCPYALTRNTAIPTENTFALGSVGQVTWSFSAIGAGCNLGTAADNINCLNGI